MGSSMTPGARERAFREKRRLRAAELFEQGVPNVLIAGVKSTRFLSPPGLGLPLTCDSADSSVVSAVPRERNRARATRLPMPAFLFMPRRTSRRDLEAALADAREQLRRHERELRTLREEADVLREAAKTLIHHAPARECFSFVHELRERFPVRRICRIIATDHSSYFAWARAEKTRTARKLDDEQRLRTPPRRPRPPGRREKPAWITLMARRKRKTLAVCRNCHTAIHAGRISQPPKE